MPMDGHQQPQQIYGAQHPPSIKLIRELSSSGGVVNASSTAATSSTLSSNQTNSSYHPPSSYKDYEKKTYDAWDIDSGDENDTGYPTTTAQLSTTVASANYHLPISIADSDAMVKQIIKSHQEKQSAKSSTSPLKSSVTSPNGPGKALRQDVVVASTAPSASSAVVGASKKKIVVPTSISSEQYLSSMPPTAAVVKLNLETSNKGSATIVTTTSSGTISSSSSSSSSGANNATRFDGFVGRNKEDEVARLEKFKQLLNADPIDLNELQKASWKGIPKLYRHICWKLLSDYLPLNLELQEKTVEQKRNAYWEAVQIHYGSSYLESHHEILRQILNDIPRMNPLLPIFQNKVIQDIFQRVLYVWAVRHPGTGYVQGINDLLTPFFVVFLTEYTQTEIQNLNIETLPKNQLLQLEADCYWCMNKLLERIQENYVCSQPGIQRNIRHLEYLIKRIDANLYNHLKKNNIEFIQFAFRWMNNLLMREIPLACTIRLWDTYHAEPFGFSDFHLYVCAAFLLRFSKNLCEEKDFQGLMMTLQNLPTKNLKTSDIELLTAEAYQLQVMFANSPNHTSN